MSAETIKLVRPASDKALRDCVTEDELALSFVDLLGKDYRYVPGWGWMHAEPTRWVRDVKLVHYNEARELCRLIGGHSPDEKRLGKAQTVAAVVQLAHADQRIVELPANKRRREPRTRYLVRAGISRSILTLASMSPSRSVVSSLSVNRIAVVHSGQASV